jgi:hypothetical protein
VYVYSASLGWHAYGTFGARKLTSLLVLMVLAGTVATSRLRDLAARNPGRMRAVLATLLVAPIAFTYMGSVIAMQRGTIKTGTPESLADFYGHGARHAWSEIEKAVGPITVLPAALIFAWRYGLHPSKYRDATDPTRWYVRVFRSEGMSFSKNTLRFTDKTLQETVSGGSAGKSGLRLKSGETARAVFTTEWPVVTHLQLEAIGSPGCRMRLGAGHLFGETWFGESPLGEDAEVSFAVPKGELRSGLNELLFSANGKGCADVMLRKITLKDSTKYPPPYVAQEKGTFRSADEIPRKPKAKAKRKAK